MSTRNPNEIAEWEVRPGGMLVQKGTDDADRSSLLIRVWVAYGSARFEISVSPHASFGELKKLLTTQCGLQHWEQRLIYHGKDRENKEFLDICGVKGRSKIILAEDPRSREKRFLEMCNSARTRRSNKLNVSFLTSPLKLIDCLAQQFSIIEKTIGNGTKVAEVQISTLIELLMIQAVQLQNIGICVEGEISAFKKLQGKRVQKCVETLDVHNIVNAKLKPAIVCSKWETFDPPQSRTQY